MKDQKFQNKVHKVILAIILFVTIKLGCKLTRYNAL